MGFSVGRSFEVSKLEGGGVCAENCVVRLFGVARLIGCARKS